VSHQKVTSKFPTDRTTIEAEAYLLVLRKPPIKAGATWRDHSIPSRWPEKVDRKLHPHVKPIGLISALIEAITNPGNLIVDPAAGSFVVMRAALELGREFIGVDLKYGESVP
jgi:site-specific DNA-methyltransferase (adenine-specific)